LKDGRKILIKIMVNVTLSLLKSINSKFAIQIEKILYSSAPKTVVQNDVILSYLKLYEIMKKYKKEKYWSFTE
jgi:hypothetical protein